MLLDPVDLHAALVVRVEAGHDLDQRGLAGTIVTEHTGDLARVHDQVDAPQRPDRAVGLSDVRHLHQRLTLVQGLIGVFSNRVGHGANPPFVSSRAS